VSTEAKMGVAVLIGHWLSKTLAEPSPRTWNVGALVEQILESKPIRALKKQIWDEGYTACAQGMSEDNPYEVPDQ
jgi:hypothetical protein